MPGLEVGDVAKVLLVDHSHHALLLLLLRITHLTKDAAAAAVLFGCLYCIPQALLVDPAHHGLLLSLVSAWPASCFHPTALIDAIAQRMQR